MTVSTVRRLHVQTLYREGRSVEISTSPNEGPRGSDIGNEGRVIVFLELVFRLTERELETSVDASLASATCPTLALSKWRRKYATTAFHQVHDATASLLTRTRSYSFSPRETNAVAPSACCKEGTCSAARLRAMAADVTSCKHTWTTNNAHKVPRLNGRLIRRVVMSGHDVR